MQTEASLVFVATSEQKPRCGVFILEEQSENCARVHGGRRVLYVTVLAWGPIVTALFLVEC